MSPEQFKHYLVGDPKFDSDHFMIFERINIFRSLKNPSLDDATQAIQDVMIQWKIHCTEEESYMEAMDFPFLKYHRQMHAALSAQLERYMSIHVIHSALVNHELYDFSIALSHHIDEADRQFYDLHKI